MESVQARQASFAKARRVKNGSTWVSLGWPHPASFHATPDALAEAGFYFSPGLENRDNVVCFACAKEVEGWEAEDDPHVVHFKKCGTVCAWAIVRCGLEFDRNARGKYTFADALRYPLGKTMENARLATFTTSGNWEHDKKKGHGANSKNMAQAGFVYTPLQEADDTATCLYCSTALDGWTTDDDPLDEHRRRAIKANTTCAFLSAFDAAAGPAPTTSRAPASKGAPPKTPARARKSTKPKPPPLPAASDAESSPDELLISHPPAKTPARTPAPRRVKRTASTSVVPAAVGKTPRARSRARSAAASEAEAETEGDDDDAASRRGSESEAGRRAVGRTRSKNTIGAIEEEEEHGAPAKGKGKKGAGRARKTVVAETPTPTEDEERVVPATVKARKGRKTITAAASDAEPVPAPAKTRRGARKTVNAAEAEVSDAPSAAAPAPVKSKRGARKTVAASEAEVSDAPSAAAPAKAAKGRKQRATNATTASMLETEEEEAPAPQPKPKPVRKTRAKSIAPSIASTADEADGAAPAKTRKRRGRSVAPSATEEEEPVAPRPKTTKRTTRNKSMAPPPTDDDDDDAVIVPAKANKRSTRSKSIAPPASDRESESAAAAPAPQTRRTRAKSVARRTETDASEDEQPGPEQTPMPRKPARGARGRSRSVAPSIVSESEVDEAPKRGRGAAAKKADVDLGKSTARRAATATAKAKAEADADVDAMAEDSEAEEPLPAPVWAAPAPALAKARAKAAPKVSMARSRSRKPIESETDEDVFFDAEEVEEPPVRAAAPEKKSGRASKAVPVRSLANDSATDRTPAAPQPVKPTAKAKTTRAPAQKQSKAPAEDVVDVPSDEDTQVFRIQHSKPPSTLSRGSTVELSVRAANVLRPLAPEDVARRTRPVDEDVTMGDENAAPTETKPKGVAERSIVHPSTPPPRVARVRSPARGPGSGHEAQKPDAASAKAGPSVLPDGFGLSFKPPLATVPVRIPAELSAAEQAMTVEEWIRHQMALEYARLKADAEGAADGFLAQAAEVRRMIEAMPELSDDEDGV